VEVTEEEFEGLVADALDGIPAAIAAYMDNVVVLVDPEPPAHDPDLLGLYDGIPLTERDAGYTFVPPDRIFVYRGPLTRMCESTDELVEEVRITVVHEVAHHFGIDDDLLHDLGYA
jgi:predicted Zn-dependent protease with MMP-like domain